MGVPGKVVRQLSDEDVAGLVRPPPATPKSGGLPHHDDAHRLKIIHPFPEPDHG
jgi:hypothetical protein